jgi:hypothetical protein
LSRPAKVVVAEQSVMKQSGHGLANLAANMPKSSAVTGLHHQISGTSTRW